MHFDLPTLLAADSFVTALSGLLLVFVCLRSADAPSALWWGLANLLVSLGTGIFAFKQELSDLGLRVAVATSLTTASSMFWAAAYRSNQPAVPPALFLAGPLLWFGSLAIPPIAASPTLQMALVGLVGAVYSPAAAFEMWRGRGVKLSARWPIFALFVLDSGINAAGAVEAYFGEVTPLALPPLTTWYGLIYFETFLLTVGGAILVVLLERERTELIHKAAAQIDALTGVANRRAFTEKALQSLDDCQREDAPLSLAFFDLDHFKAINDNNGHAVGDRALRRFADVARTHLRPDDIIGRVGGEEFAVLLPRVSPGAAYVIADRIRVAFNESCRNLDELSLDATVSAGIAEAHAWSTFDTLMQAGDEALYRAKTRGRNRVEHPARVDRPPPNVIRVA
jgi:diguanylate cyclase (GGDEF)-like protein